jgi:hypothetical protein
MQNYEYDFDGITLNVGFYTEDADPSVGIYSTEVFIEGICHNGEDIIELIKPETIKNIEEALWSYVND